MIVIMMKGILRYDYKVEVSDSEDISKLRNMNMGIMLEERKLLLFEEEYLYLLYHDKIEIYDVKKNKKYSFEELIDVLQDIDPRIWFKFIVYLDLRDRGYYIKKGPSKYIPFRLYEKGDISKAKYYVIVFIEGEQISTLELTRILYNVQREDKRAIIAVVDSNGDITYYEASLVNLEK